MKKIFIILHVIQTCLCASVSAYHEIFFQKAKKDFFFVILISRDKDTSRWRSSILANLMTRTQ